MFPQSLVKLCLLLWLESLNYQNILEITCNLIFRIFLIEQVFLKMNLICPKEIQSFATMILITFWRTIVYWHSLRHQFLVSDMFNKRLPCILFYFISIYWILYYQLDYSFLLLIWIAILLQLVILQLDLVQSKNFIRFWKKLT